MMPSDETDDIAQARRWFAEELRHTAHVRSPSVVEAFATVPREHFAGPGPWRVLSPMAGPDYWTTDDADPRHLCHDVLVAIDETRRLANLATAWPQANVIAADGFAFRADEPVEAIVVNAGVSHLALPWLDSLNAVGGRLLVPLTNANLWGAFLVVERRGSRYPVHCAARVGIIACAGGRDAEAETRLTAALARSDYTAVKSLRRPPDEPDDTCWLAGEGWWLSTAPPEETPEHL
jgi:protein-L-isoaspartate(D-aspartate) O-methyltransferase